MDAALRCGRLETDLVAVEARRSVDAAVPVAVVTAPAAVSEPARALPALSSYDELLAVSA